MQLHKDKAFILKTILYSESDLIVHALSQHNGRLHFFARGARKSKKRFSGGLLQVPHLIEFELTGRKEKEDGGLLSLKEARLVKDFYELRESYKKIQLLSSLIKVVMASDDAGQETLFNHYGGALKALCLPELNASKSRALFFNHFVVRYLFLEGVLPSKDEFIKYVSLPMVEHASLPQLSEQEIKEDSGLASYFFHKYSGLKRELIWPN